MSRLVVLTIVLALAPAAGPGLPPRAPADVGMSAERLALIDHVMSRGLQAGGYPGAAVVVGRRGASVWSQGYGRLDWDANAVQVYAGSAIYDLASLTKPIATATAVMLLYDDRLLALDDPVSRYLPEFTGGGRERVTIRQLLTHRSGLPSGRDLWRAARTPAEARRLVLSTPLAWPPGERMVYSDLGADVLALVAEAAAREPLDAFLTRRVFKPLRMRDTGFRPPELVRYRIAPTETTPPRGYALKGEVHDENAYALGGVAGHAGLFSTAADISVFAQMMLDGGEYGGVRIISDSTIRRFTSRSAGTRALGWDTCDGGASCGQHMGTHAYGHTGYAGTSIWMDPDRELFVIVLSNAVHETPAGVAPNISILQDVRADVADIAELAVTDAGDTTRMPQLRADRATGWSWAGAR